MIEHRVFSAPHRYIQGAGAVDLIGTLVRPRHTTAVCLVDELLMDMLGERLTGAFASAGVGVTLSAVEGEVTQERIDALAAEVAAQQPSVVVAVGGGKTLDTGKGVARTLGARVVTVPTIASNDGPTSRVIALYDENHQLIATPTLLENPECVVVDTQLIANAPTRFLLSGIGDAAAKKFEAAACVAGTGVTSNGTRPLEIPLAIADACYRTLLVDAEEALASADRHVVTPALERVVEAVILMSGLAFENGGLSLAHSMTRGLMAASSPVGSQLHGYHVAYGLLVQLIHEHRLEDYESIRLFFRAVGLPTSLADLGGSLDDLDVLVSRTLTAPHMSNCSPEPTYDSLALAIQTVEGVLGA